MAADARSPVVLLAHQLRDPVTYEPADAATRARVAAALAAHPDDPEAAETLVDLLVDENATVREAAVASLATVFAARPAAILEVVDDDLSISARPGCYEAIRRSLARVDSREALDVLLAAVERGLDVKEHEWLLHDLAATSRFPNELLVARMQEEDGDEPEAGVLLARVLDRRGVEAGPVYLLRQASARYVGELLARGAEGVRILCRAGCHLEPEVRDDIVRHLGEHRKRTEATVREVATDPRAPGAATAVRALGYWDEPEHVETLLAIACDRAHAGDVRDGALEALARIEAPEALETLCAALEDDSVSEYTRWRCAEGLGAIGNAGALPALEAAAKAHEQDRLGHYARSAIAEIRNP